MEKNKKEKWMILLPVSSGTDGSVINVPGFDLYDTKEEAKAAFPNCKIAHVEWEE